MAGTPVKDDAAVRDQTSLHDTRQLLDELDALMDQMLALPIDDQENADEAPTAAAPPPATISATLTLVETAVPTEASPSPVERPERIQPTRFDHATTTTPAPTLTEVGVPKPVDLLPLPPPVALSRWRPDHISYQFLLWVNQRFDHGTTWLGKPGHFLRTSAGKMFVGVTGLALLAMGLTWLAKDWLGWNW